MESKRVRYEVIEDPEKLEEAPLLRRLSRVGENEVRDPEHILENVCRQFDEGTLHRDTTKLILANAVIHAVETIISKEASNRKYIHLDRDTREHLERLANELIWPEHQSKHHEIQLLQWVAACKCDILLFWSSADCDKGWSCSKGSDDILRDPDNLKHLSNELKLISPTMLEVETNHPMCYWDLNSTWMSIMQILRHVREIRTYHAVLHAYVIRLYLRLIIFTLVVEPHHLTRTYHQPNLTPLFPEFPHGWQCWSRGGASPHLINHGFFQRSKRTKGKPPVRLTNRAFLRESFLVMQELFELLEPRSYLPVIALQLSPSRMQVPKSAEKSLCRWSLRIASGVLADYMRMEFRQRIFQVNLEPYERERFMREDRFNKPSSYNAIARYRPDTLDALVAWVNDKKHFDPISLLITRYLEEKGEDPAIPLYYLVEQLSFEIVFKYAFDTICGVNCLIDHMFERHRRYDMSKSPSRLMMVQLINRYELVLYTREEGYQIYQEADTLPRQFIRWVWWMVHEGTPEERKDIGIVLDLYRVLFRRDVPEHAKPTGEEKAQPVAADLTDTLHYQLTYQF